ncbi:carbohydrate ABC transporter permease [Glycomyces buryatensis]|uniref:Sugar ABC transporter permease n=1 Tax=Glycomyces buryatensis TaxID=2570927 RepID=A0A4V4HSW5_9ACTN|nr:sugar ABC transporter permease [Glycomyces buryatensis]THV43256.1 sugar ABC transporter permease [Glycomyces buryatensis]
MTDNDVAVVPVRPRSPDDDLNTSKPPSARTRRRTGNTIRSRERWAALSFMAPWLIGLAVITIGPMVYSFYLSFTDYSLGYGEWTGMENYRRMADDSRLAQSVKVTAIYTFVSVPLQLAMALLLAIVLDRGLRGMAFYRSVFYLPSLLGSSVAIAIMWRQIFGTEGLVNQFLALFGIEGQGWVSSPDTALGTLIILHVWTFGSPMIIFLAGLRQIPTMYYEAAKVDGAGPLRRFRSVTLPLLTPIIFFNLVLQVIQSFQSFTQAFIVSGGKGGPADSTLFLTLYLYDQGFTQFNMGYASAIAWLLLAIIAIFTALNFLMSKFWVFYGDND